MDHVKIVNPDEWGSIQLLINNMIIFMKVCAL